MNLEEIAEKVQDKDALLNGCTMQDCDYDQILYYVQLTVEAMKKLGYAIGRIEAEETTDSIANPIFDNLPPAEGPAATEKQTNYIRSLADERGIEIPLDPAANSLYALTVPQASEVIDRLLAAPKVAQKAPEGSSKVAPGYYALSTNGGMTVLFYRVQRAKDGIHAGKTFVNRQSGDNWVRISKTEANGALEEILEDPKAAGVLYGQEIGRCCKCNRTLTDEKSRKDGIGPECIKSNWNES